MRAISAIFRERNEKGWEPRHSEGIEGQAGFWQTSLLVRAAGFVTSTNSVSACLWRGISFSWLSGVNWAQSTDYLKLTKCRLVRVICRSCDFRVKTARQTNRKSESPAVGRVFQQQELTPTPGFPEPTNTPKWMAAML